jgi:hypothetical protein
LGIEADQEPVTVRLYALVSLALRLQTEHLRLRWLESSMIFRAFLPDIEVLDGKELGL